MTNTVKFKWNNQSLKRIERNTLEGMWAMASDIQTKAKVNAPYVTGALSNSIRTEHDGFIIYIKAGGSVAPSSVGPKYVNYAMAREIGPNRDPSTVHYMRNAMNAIMTGNYMEHYFGRITE